MKKYELYNFLVTKQPYFTVGKLLSNYSELEAALNNMDFNNVSKYCYFDLKNIDNILYDEEQIISFNNNNNYDFSFYYYLGLSIEYNPDKINFIYNKDFIIHLNNKNKRETSKIKKLIVSKIILTLIYNFNGINSSWDDNIKNEINNIKNENLKNLKNTINIFKELDL